MVSADFLMQRSDVGRRKLLRSMASLLVISLTVIVTYVEVLGTDRLPQQITRLILSVLLFYWLYTGSKLARWICIALFWIGGVGMAMLIGPAFQTGTLHGLTTLSDACVMLLFARTLIWSADVELFLARQRSDRAAVERQARAMLSGSR